MILNNFNKHWNCNRRRQHTSLETYAWNKKEECCINFQSSSDPLTKSKRNDIVPCPMYSLIGLIIYFIFHGYFRITIGITGISSDGFTWHSQYISKNQFICFKNLTDFNQYLWNQNLKKMFLHYCPRSGKSYKTFLSLWSIISRSL